MLRKILTLSILFIFLFNSIIFADDTNENETFEIIDTSSISYSIPETKSKHFLVLERTTQTVLLEKNGYTKTPMASTTKIMTAIIAIENSNLSDMVTISKKASHTGGSTLGIKENSVLSMEALLYGLLLRSGNDCAVAIAEYISNDIPAFSILMNKKANELNLKNTNFVTPHGLDSENHYTTAFDLAILTNYALENETFRKIVNTKSTTITMGKYDKQINNTHELLGNIEGVYGVKTGFTGLAGRCLVTACKKKYLDIIIVVLGADTKKIRSDDTIKLINYIFSNYEMVNTEKYLKSKFSIKEININNSFQKAEIILENKNNYHYPLPKTNIKFTTKIYILPNTSAPLNKDYKIGIVKLFANDNFLYETNIILLNDIKSASVFEYYKYILFNIKTLFS